MGGGIGVAPLALWQRVLAAQGTQAPALIGFRDAAHAGGRDLFAGEVQIATDDGHAGIQGTVMDLLGPLMAGGPCPVYACGPPAMLEAVRAAAAAAGAPGQLAMESGMACGYGACMGCVVPTRDGYVRLCVGRPGCRDLPPGDRAGSGGGALTAGQATDLAGIALEHPVINASGTFDPIAAQRAFGAAVVENFPFAAFVSKTITPERRDGNPPPRLWEAPGGLINSIGLPGKGLDGFCTHDLPQLARLPVPLIVSVMATAPRDFAAMVERLDAEPSVAGFELNVSCPNVHSGLVVGEEPTEAAALLAELRPRTDKPLIVKLTPNAAHPELVATAAAEQGADGIAVINTLKAMAIGPGTSRPWLGAGRGGLSGPAVRAVALAQVAAIAETVGLPIVGMGGVATGRHAFELLAAGATCVAVGTESFRDPVAGHRVASELACELDGAGFATAAHASRSALL
ncbi:MAG: dihydroorotate dehydrogenase [Solirubrobacterales bacterium]